MVIGPRIDSEVRRGQDYVRVVVVATIVTADVAQAAIVAWRAFRRAAGEDLAGWDVAAATAEVRPGRLVLPLDPPGGRVVPGGDQCLRPRAGATR